MRLLISCLVLPIAAIGSISPASAQTITSWIGAPAIPIDAIPEADSGYHLEALKINRPTYIFVGYEQDFAPIYQWIIPDSTNRTLVRFQKVDGSSLHRLDTLTILLLFRSVVLGVDQRRDMLQQQIDQGNNQLQQYQQDLQATKANLTATLGVIEDLRSRIRVMECKEQSAGAACMGDHLPH